MSSFHLFYFSISTTAQPIFHHQIKFMLISTSCSLHCDLNFSFRTKYRTRTSVVVVCYVEGYSNYICLVNVIAVIVIKAKSDHPHHKVHSEDGRLISGWKAGAREVIQTYANFILFKIRLKVLIYFQQFAKKA